MLRRGIAAIAIASCAATALPSTAAAPVVPITGPAVATQAAVAVNRSPDVVNVSQTTFVTPGLEARVQAAVGTAGGSAAPGRGASIGMTGLWRGSSAVQLAPAGYQIPMSVTVLDVDVVATLMGRSTADPLAAGQVVMGRTSADLRGAHAGDSLNLIASDGGTVVLQIGLVADDAVVGGTEVLMAPAQADALGVSEVTRLVITGFADRTAMLNALAANGVVTTASIDGQRTRVRTSWDPPDPDSSLGMARTKLLLGEFAFRDLGDGSIAMSSDWVDANLPPEREWLYAYSGAPSSTLATVRARCHKAIKNDLVAALAEIHAAGLDPAIDFSNANAYGGCFNPRFNRVTGSIGFISRHAWAMAFDTNTTTNPQGGTPQMNCDVVRIFRRHNFAWGGNFTSRDGMHFEWVGERRDQLPYPSTYCPNTVATVTLGPPSPTLDSRATLFADDGTE